ncbi:MAG TPA: ABC transporter substrate-binding protein [Methylomirabilota bacterium]|nr:ABC transporter substrate-binding protein [Methylomirabilota bacterium]
MSRLAALLLGLILLVAGVGSAAAQAKPEGEMRWALYVTLAPAWYDPAEVVGVLTPFWVMYAMHDALVKPIPGAMLGASLAESWKVSADQRVYDFKLREGLKFHNGDPFTAEDVKWSFLRAKGNVAKVLRDKVSEIEIAGPYRVRFHLHEPWPDFMMFYGTFATGAGWITPKKYMEQVGLDGFKKHPVGLGPYKFVSHTPGVELVMEAFEGYWRKMPSVKRLVYKSVPEATTRLAMLKRGEVDLAYLLDAPQALEVKRDPTLKLAFSGGIGTFYVDFLDQWDPKSPWHDRRVRLAANHAIDRQALSDAETLGASRVTGSLIPAKFEYALAIEPYPYDPARAKQLLAEAGYPNGFDAGELYPWPPYTSMGEAVGGYLGAVGIKVRLRTMERAAFYAALATKKLHGLCVCINAVYGNAASRMAETVPSEGAFAYGGYPDVDALYKQQSRETDPRKREALLHQIQRLLHERARFVPIMEYIWPSGVGPKVADPALMLIDPYPWSAPLEEVRLKK